VLFVHAGHTKSEKVSPLSFDIVGMPVHALPFGPLISILVTLSKHSSITVVPRANMTSVIVRVPAACVIFNETYPALPSYDCVVTRTQSEACWALRGRLSRALRGILSWAFRGRRGWSLGGRLSWTLREGLSCVGNVLGLLVGDLVGLFVGDLVRLASVGDDADGTGVSVSGFSSSPTMTILSLAFTCPLAKGVVWVEEESKRRTDTSSTGVSRMSMDTSDRATCRGLRL
jgi:hypothetical protein